MLATVADEVGKYLRTGEHDTLAHVWPGSSVIERCAGADKALRDALVAEVLARTAGARTPRGLADADLVASTRATVAPMVDGLFPSSERPVIAEVLARSVVYLTPRNIEAVLHGEAYLHTAWNLANLYLQSCEADPLSSEAPQIIGLSQATTCFVSMRYFKCGGRFDDVVLHEAAHIFHNCKRERIGLPFTARREWLLDIAFDKRETFAYACEALGRIHSLGRTRFERQELLAEFEAGPMPAENAVDVDELVDILREAVAARNDWRHIHQRCTLPKRTRRPG